MSNNCLLSKLKAAVDNPMLKGLNEFEMDARYTESSNPIVQSFTIQMTTSESGTIYVTEGGAFAESLEALETNPLTSLSYTGAKTLYFKNANYKIRIADKSKIRTLASSTETYTRLRVVMPTVEQLSYLPICTKITIVGVNFEEDITELRGLPALTDLRFMHNNAFGDIQGLAKFKGLTTLRLDDTKLTGTLESFLEAQWQGPDGRKSGSISTLHLENSLVTFHGNVPTGGLSAQFADGGITVTEGGTTIATYNGSTWSYV